MFTKLIMPLRYALTSLVSGDSPRQLAAGIALGMIVGFLPKGNLIAVSLFVAIFAFRVNETTALLSVMFFSVVGAAMDPFAHKLGTIVLTYQPLEFCYASIYNLPLGPWLGFNNTVVAGSLCTSLYFVYPTYWAGLIACERLQPRAGAWVGRSRVASWLLDAASQEETTDRGTPA